MWVGERGDRGGVRGAGRGGAYLYACVVVEVCRISRRPWFVVLQSQRGG